MNVTLPAEPNSDHWISFHRSGKGRFTLAETCAFRLPEDTAVDDRVWDAAGINLFPKELAVDVSWADLNGHYDAFVQAKAPEEEAKAYEARAAQAAQRPASSTSTDASDAGLATKDDRDFASEEFRKISKIWGEIAANEVSEESMALVRTRLNMTCAWALLADRLLDDAASRAVERIQQDVQRLLQRMSEGKEEVGDMYFDLITTLIHQMNNLRETQGEMVDRMVRWRVRWPALTAAHPPFRRYQDPPKSLGSGYPFRMDSGSRWDPALDAGQVALHLAFFMDRLKQAVTKFAKDGRHPPTRFHQSLQDVLALKALPKSATDWWEPAKWHFLKEYPEPESNPRFDAWLTSPDHRKSPKEMRRRILERLGQTFTSVLGGKPLK